MFSFPDASRLLGIPFHFQDPAVTMRGASIDTRTLRPGNLFVALRGTQCDGHQFLAQAFGKGASGAVIEEGFFRTNSAFLKKCGAKNLLVTTDPQKALWDLAAFYRNLFDLPTVGITGSVGKTSTKEFLSYLLGRKFSVLSNQGNFNNHLGLPLTLFRLDSEHDFCVAELGASHAGEIRSLGKLLKPDIAVITQISPAHVSGFGSLEGIYQAKLEILEGLKPGAAAIFPDHDPILIEKAKQFPVRPILVGKKSRAEYRLSDVSLKDSQVHFLLNGWKFSFPGIAGFLAQNAAMAIAAAESLGIKISDMPSVWEDFKLPKGRSEEQWLDGIRIIDDGYNANPASFDAAIETFNGLDCAGRKFLIFSDMLELGGDEIKYHELLGQKIARSSADQVAAYGPRSLAAIERIRKESSKPAHYFNNAAETGMFLSGQLREGDAVLLKASRGMKIEEVLSYLQPKFTVKSLP